MLGCMLCCFSRHQLGAGWHLEQLGLEPALIWNASAAGRRFTCYSTMQPPHFSFFSFEYPNAQTPFYVSHTALMYGVYPSVSHQELLLDSVRLYSSSDFFLWRCCSIYFLSSASLCDLSMVFLLISFTCCDSNHNRLQLVMNLC